MIRLYNYWRSSSSWRVRIALNLKGFSFEYVPIHLVREGGEQNQPGYQEKNPSRTVPLLESDEGGSLVRISQSLAIIEYLDERHPNPPLLPKDPLQRARARQLAELVNSGIQPLQNLAVLNHVESIGGDKKAWAAHWVRRGLEALEPMVAASAGAYCVGNQVSVADLCLIPQLYSARRFGVDVSPFHTLLRVEAACEQLPAFQAAHADRQPDAQPA